MIDIIEFTHALKSSWIRRLLKQKTNWISLLEAEMKTKVNDLCVRGIDFISILRKKLSNIFWKDVFKSWTKVTEITSKNNEHPFFENIWFNPNMKLENSAICSKSYIEAGIVCIIDLFNEDGSFRSLESLFDLNIKTNFLEYNRLKYWVFKRIGNCNIKTFREKVEPYIPNALFIFYKNVKGCKDMYNVLINEKKSQVSAKLKWIEENDPPYEETDWHKIFELPFKITRDSKLQWLQFQTLHRILPTNYYLHKLKLIESPNCSFCRKHPETIDHLFVECYEVKKLWRAVEDLFLRQYMIPITFDRHNIIFGKYEDCKKNRVPNLLIFITKHYIFTCRFKTVPTLIFMDLKEKIKSRFLIEKYLLLRNCKFDEYENHWQHIIDSL